VQLSITTSQKHSYHQILDAAGRLLAHNPDFMMDELGTAVFLSRAALYGKSTFSTPFCWQENEVTCYQDI
jgi:hypothetical protein